MRNFTQNLAFLLVAALCCFGMQVKAEELTVNNGTSTISNVPIYGLYGDYGCRSQFIIPEDSLSDMANGTISGMKFYSSTASQSLSGTWEVYMKEVEETSATSAFISRADAALVWTGSPDVVNNEWEIVFDESFAFGGGNLMIEFVETVMGNYPSLAWYGASGSSVYVTGGSSDHTSFQTAASGTTTSYCPKVTFTYEAGGGVACEKPSAILAENVGSKTASLSWADGSGVFNVELKKGSEDWQPLLTGTNAVSHELSGLVPNTAYQARVQSVCGEDLSGWKSVSFNTLIGIPYSEQFATTPAGWSDYSGIMEDVLNGTATLTTYSPSGYTGWTVGESNGVFEGSHLKCDIWGGSCKYWKVSPIIPLDGDLQLTFDIALTKYSSLTPVDANQQQDDIFALLISTDEGVTWTVLRQWDNAGSEYVYDEIACSVAGEEVVIDLTAYSGINVQFAFYAESTASGGDNYLHIDNVLIDYIPRCLKPTDLAAGSIVQNSAEISWTANSGETEWILQFKKSAESTWQSVTVTENPYLLDGLDTYTSYDVQIAAHCDDLDEFGTSAFCNPISFKTVAGIPFVENFQSSMPSDWKQYTGLLDEFDPEENPLTPVSYGWSVGNVSGVFADSPNHLYKEIYGTTCANWLVTPAIAISGNVQMTFDMALTTTSGGEITDGNQNDDKFIILYSLDDGASWEELTRWDNESSAQAYDAISKTGQSVRIDLTEFDGESMRFALYAESTEAGGDNYLHIDNFKIDEIPACEQPADLELSNISDAEATFAWAEVAGASWQFGVIANPADELEPTDEMFTGATSSNTVTIDTLHENSPYAFILRQDCGGVYSKALVRRFRSLQQAANLPFEDDFEGGNGWLFVNGSLTNAWAYGEAATASGHAIYVSNDNGEHNEYNNSKEVVVYAIKLFHVAQDGAYNVQFDWKASGESTYDYLRAAIVPANVELTASTSLPSGFSTTTLPEGWIAIDGGSYLNQSSSWQTKTVEVDLEEGSYNVVFGWRDDTSQGTNPPAAIDNFSFSLMACPAPGELAADPEQVTTHSIALTWKEKGSASAWKIRYKKITDAEWTVVADPITDTEYTLDGLDAASTYSIQVAAWCDPEDAEGISAYSEAISVSTLCDVIATFPWSENFDNVSTDLPMCWSSINTCTYSYYAGYPKVNNSSSYANSGLQSLYFNSVQDDYYDYYDPQDQYAILPEMEGINGLRMKFFARAYSTSYYYDASFLIGVMSDPEDESTFEALATFNPTTTTYEQYEVRFNTYTGAGKHIAIKLPASTEDYRSVLIDDIEISEIPSCEEATGLNVVEVAATSAILAWDNIEGGAWKYAYAPAIEAEPAVESFIAIAKDTVQLEGLESSTTYKFYLRRDCGSSVSPVISISFQTKQAPVAVPFADNFEDGNKWFFINGDLTNAWAYGEAATESGHALYISQNNGVANTYNTSAAAMVYAVKLFSFAQGTYTFQYDWKANGENNYDYLRVALVPANVELTANTTVPSGFGTSSLPTGWIALDGGSKLNLSGEWATFTTAEIAIPAGEYKVVLAWRDDTSTGSNPPAAIDNFSISKVACAKQTALEIDAITATTARLSWTAGDEEQDAWDIAIDTIAGFNPDTLSVLLEAHTNPYVFQNLEPEKRYYVYIRANCGEVVGDWSAVKNFKTASACETPSALKANVTSNSATISWNAYGLDEFNLRYSEDGTIWENINAVAMPYTIESLLPNTSYRVQVQATCNTAVWSTALNFKTACEAWSIELDGDYEEDFESYTGVAYDAAGEIPSCWDVAIGPSATVLPHVVGGTGNYVYKHSGSQSLSFHGKDNCYAALPVFAEALNGLQISFWMQTESASNGQLTLGYITASDPGDFSTFKPYVTYANSYNAMINRETMLDTIPAEAYRLAFRWYYNGQWSCCIDDIDVTFIPACLKPTGLSVSEVAPHTAVLDWTSDDATAWQICLNDDDDEANWIDADTKPFVLQGLDPETSYSVKVRANCTDEDNSEWSSSISFTTLVACPAPTALKAILTPGNGSIATLQWTAGAEEEAWVIEYDTDAAFANAIDSAVVEPTIDLTGLVAEQTYFARVKAVCGGDDGESVWSASISFVPTNARELTLNDGEDTNGFIPIHGINVDYGTSVSQFIIPAEDLAGVIGDSIMQLTFYTSQATVGWSGAEFEVYMAETDETSISDLTDWSALNIVMEAVHLEIVNHEMVVVLDEPYKYEGENLLIGFQQTESGSWGSSSWYGITASGASVGGDGAVSQQNFLPKMKINFVEGEDVPGPGEGIFHIGADGKAVKFIRNNHVYILVNGTVYNVTGQKVEVK